MSTIYKGQNYTLTLDTTIDVSAATTLEIHYRKPDNSTTAALTAAVSETTKAQVNVGDTVNDTAGWWAFQVYVELASGAKYYGETYLLEVKELYL